MASIHRHVPKMAATKWSDSITATKAYKSSLHKVVGNNVGSLQNGSDIYFGITKPTNQIFTKWSDSITATKAVCTKWWDIMWDMWESYKMVLISTLEITNPTIQIFTKWSDSLTATKKVCTKWWDSYKMVLVPFLEVAKHPKSDLYKMDP